MSHYSEMKVNYKQKFESDFVSSLEDHFGKGTVTVSEDGEAMYGYQGDNRSEKAKTSSDYAPKCHIIIRKKHVGSASNDIGYYRLEDGSYKAYISDYDKGVFKQEYQDKVAKNYAEKVATKQLKSSGYTVKRSVTSDGKVKLTASKWAKS